MKTLSKLFGVISLVAFATGILFKFLGMPEAHNLQVLGLFVFSIGFAPIFLKVKLAEETRRAARISHAFFLIATVLMFLAAQFRILELFGGMELTYLGLLMFMVYAVFFSQPQEGRKLRIQKDRQLAAIVFTDIVGYTRMMGQDEDAGLEMLDLNRKIHKKWVVRFRGQVLKEMGDGTIAIFYTATEALLCGLEIQRETNQSGKYKLRMGIHISEIVFTDADAFGDGMNLASRISNQAKEGEIVISDTVFQNIRNRESVTAEPMGSIPLKNVEQPLPLYRIQA